MGCQVCENMGDSFGRYEHTYDDTCLCKKPEHKLSLTLYGPLDDPTVCDPDNVLELRHDDDQAN